MFSLLSSMSPISSSSMKVRRGSNTNQNRFPNASSYIFGIKMFQIPFHVRSSYIYHVLHCHTPLPFLGNKTERTSGHFYITCWLDPHAPYDKWNCVTKVKWTILEATHTKRCRAFASSKSFRIELSRTVYKPRLSSRLMKNMLEELIWNPTSEKQGGWAWKCSF